MRNNFGLVLLLLPLLSFSQRWNDRSKSWEGFKGISVGFLFETQTQYPDPYYGPEIKGLLNNGAYHFMIDFYVYNFSVGYHLTDEYLFLQKFDASGAVWKPRGFNGDYSSLTKTHWITVGYQWIDNFYVKLGVGLRSGSKKPIILSSYTSSEVANNFDFSNPQIIYNTAEGLTNFSELDFLLSFSYTLKIIKNWGLVPEIGYSFKHSGVLTGMSIIY